MNLIFDRAVTCGVCVNVIHTMCMIFPKSSINSRCKSMIYQVHMNNITLCHLKHEKMNTDCQLSVLKISNEKKEYLLTCEVS